MRYTVFGPGHPFRGGISSTTTSLVEALRTRGHDVDFITPYRQYPARLFPGSTDRDPDACPELDGARPLLSPFEPWSWVRARRRALENDSDWWIFPYWTWVWAPMWLALLRARARPPAVGIVHNPTDHDGGVLRAAAARQVLNRCRALFTHAGVLADGLRRNHPETPIGHHILPPPARGPDRLDRAAERERLGVGPDRLLAVFFGIIRPYKGVDLLVEAMARLEGAGRWRLLVAGEPWGELGDALAKQVENLPVGTDVDLRLGWVSESDVESMLAAADLVVLPYRSGTQSAVAPLALSRGVPVLSTEIGGLAEVVEDGVNGLLVEPGSAQAVADALRRLEEPGVLERLASGAAASMKGLTWDGYARALERLLPE